LAQYFEKLKKNFPLYDNIKNEGNGKKNKKKKEYKPDD
jgi:beta-1,4-N-acetylglucosaminyltransferase